MEEFLSQMAELLEVDVVNPTDELASFEVWDSLTILSILALSDDQYGAQLTAKEIRDAKTIEGVYNLIQSKK